MDSQSRDVGLVQIRRGSSTKSRSSHVDALKFKGLLFKSIVAPSKALVDLVDHSSRSLELRRRFPDIQLELTLRRFGVDQPILKSTLLSKRPRYVEPDTGPPNWIARHLSEP